MARRPDAGRLRVVRKVALMSQAAPMGGFPESSKAATSKVGPIALLALFVVVGVALLHALDKTPSVSERTLEATEAATSAANAPVARSRRPLWLFVPRVRSRFLSPTEPRFPGWLQSSMTHCVRAVTSLVRRATPRRQPPKARSNTHRATKQRPRRLLHRSTFLKTW